MRATRRIVTIDNPQQLILTNLPFRQGQRVEIVFLAEEEPAYRIAELKELFRVTQALPQAQTITEAEIAAEIATYRANYERNR
ncbi:MAG: hypothetical protein IAE79_25865 [Anaerolinea sp.]|nr:hypothetical protein [Anaerolinea sp.]